MLCRYEKKINRGTIILGGLQVESAPDIVPLPETEEAARTLRSEACACGSIGRSAALIRVSWERSLA